MRILADPYFAGSESAGGHEYVQVCRLLGICVRNKSELVLYEKVFLYLKKVV